MKLTVEQLKKIIREAILEQAQEDSDEDMEEMGPAEPLDEVSPPGWKGSVKAMKKHKEIDNPFALAWSMKKKGDEPHYKSSKKSPPEKKEKFKESATKLKEASGRREISDEILDILYGIEQALEYFAYGNLSADAVLRELKNYGYFAKQVQKLLGFDPLAEIKELAMQEKAIKPRIKKIAKLARQELARQASRHETRSYRARQADIKYGR